ncbi:MAG: cysteine--tRNA ligase [Rhodospirillales bacterium]
MTEPAEPQIYLHNTLTRKKEAFAPIDAAHVRMYVCGPTVYDDAHIGNARPVVVFDVLARMLRRRYPRVTYVRNITDVDDKINARAAEAGESIRDITERTAARFREHMAALNAEPPDAEPRATEHIEQMIAMIRTLIEKGHAYEAEGHVLFHTPGMADYGALSGRDRDEQIAGARVEVAPYKKDPADFVLWKPSDDAALPGWDSPWGRGRPGWHIECSAMAAEILGETFDIHGGGVDLVFPHHENEIAQSRCAHGTEAMARYWMHNGYVMSEGEKMAKSAGNFYTVADLLSEFPGEAVRLMLLKTHYRKPLDFTKDGLAEAKKELDGFYGALRRAGGVDWIEPDDIEAKLRQFEDALGDDLNTPLAMTILHARLRQLNLTLDDERPAGAWPRAKTPGCWRKWALGWACWAKTRKRGSSRAAGGRGGRGDGPADSEIETLLAERDAARKAKDFARADEIRDSLKAQGIIIEDGPGGALWKRA